MKPGNKKLLLRYIQETFSDCFVLYSIKEPHQKGRRGGTIIGVDKNSVKVVFPMRDFDSRPDIMLVPVETAKPYLRPISDITEEEKKVLYKEVFYGVEYNIGKNGEVFPCQIKTDGIYYPAFSPKICQNYLRWLGKHQFDYMGLIKNRLAIKVGWEFYQFKCEV